MADLRRDSQRLILAKSQSIAASAAFTSDVWNITPGQAFSLWTEALTASASVSVAINMYPGLNGGGVKKTDSLASAAAVGVLSESSIQINADICKSVSVTLTNNGSSAAVVTQSLLMF